MKIVGFIFCIIFFSCLKKQTKQKAPIASITTSTKKIINYDSCKNQVILVKKKFAKQWHQLASLQKQKIFTQAITQQIMPSWIGTTWSFYGTSQTPQKGSIACGYFVTTVLQDGGVQLARVKLAQYASEQMITTLVQAKYIKRFSNLPISNFVDAVNKMGYGLYIVGLDNHTGFIYNDGKAIHFIHSTFVGTKNVQWENAEKSWVLSSSKYKVLGKISEDEKVLERWIL